MCLPDDVGMGLKISVKLYFMRLACRGEPCSISGSFLTK